MNGGSEQKRAQKAPTQLGVRFRSMITLLRPPPRDERGDERHLDGTGPRAAATLNGVVRLLDHRHFQWLVLAVCATATAGIITHLLAAPAALIAQILCIPAALLAVTFAALSAVLLTSALLLGRRNLELAALDGWPLRHLLLRLGAAVLLLCLLASPPMPEGWLRAPLACNSLLILASTTLLALAPEDPLRLPPPGSPEASAALTPQRALEIQYSMHPLLFPLCERLVGRSRAIATAESSLAKKLGVSSKGGAPPLGYYEGHGLFTRLAATDAMKQHVANKVCAHTCACANCSFRALLAVCALLTYTSISSGAHAQQQMSSQANGRGARPGVLYASA